MIKLLYLSTGRKVYHVPCGEVDWNTERVGKPSSIHFTVPRNALKVKIENGAYIQANWKDKPFFAGFIFTIEENEDEVSFTAYDQLRYLMYNDTMTFKGATATQVIKRICNAKKINIGNICNTYAKIDKLIFDDNTYLDMFYTALEKTLEKTKIMYCLYDHAGKLTLKPLNDVKTNLVIGDKYLLMGFSKSRSIDGETYNLVKVVNKVEKKGANGKKKPSQKTYISKGQANMKKWGTLMKIVHIDNYSSSLAKRYSKNLLTIHNREEAKLSITSVGNIQCRAGANVMINSEKAGFKNRRLVIESAKHKFLHNNHEMDLELKVYG